MLTALVEAIAALSVERAAEVLPLLAQPIAELERAARGAGLSTARYATPSLKLVLWTGPLEGA